VGSRLWQRFCDLPSDDPTVAEKPGMAPRRRGRSKPIAPPSTRRSPRSREPEPSAHWIALFEDAGIPCGPIYAIDQVFADPQVRHLGLAMPMQSPALGRLDVVSSALDFSGHARAVRRPTPEAGEHTREVLREAGLSEAEIDAVIGAAP
jgi:crotonobetainyl-CoA:carnitine CoA-transferase CaiB-like acyl-CoA transferase